jgi:hypothetical protein
MSKRNIQTSDLPISVVQTGSIFTNQIVGGGQVNELYALVTGQLGQIALGTAASPNTVAQPVWKVERYMAVPGLWR